MSFASPAFAPAGHFNKDPAIASVGKRTWMGGAFAAIVAMAK